MTTTVAERAIAHKYADRAALLGAHGKWQILDRDGLSSLPPPTWVIGAGPRNGGFPVITDGLSLLYGISGSGKSTLALEWACIMASGGTNWRGCVVRPGPVLYYATEAARGLAPRMDAIREYKQIRSGPYPLVIPAHGLRMDDPTHVDAMRDDVRIVKPSMIVVDTLANCLGDLDENSAGDMTKFFVAMASVTNGLDDPPATLVVHHSGHDVSRERGSSAIRARMDTSIKVEVTQEDEDSSDARLRIVCSKQREDRRFTSLRAQRTVHEGGVVLQWL